MTPKFQVGDTVQLPQSCDNRLGVVETFYPVWQNYLTRQVFVYRVTDSAGEGHSLTENQLAYPADSYIIPNTPDEVALCIMQGLGLVVLATLTFWILT